MLGLPTDRGNDALLGIPLALWAKCFAGMWPASNVPNITITGNLTEELPSSYQFHHQDSNIQRTNITQCSLCENWLLNLPASSFMASASIQTLQPSASKPAMVLLHDSCATRLICAKVGELKVSKLPCLRYKITDVRLFVTSMAPGRVWSTRWQDTRLKDINDWASPEIRTVKMTQDFSPRPMIVKVRKFVPLESDMLHRSWVHGVVGKSVTLPPYAFANMRAALQTYLDYINQEGSEHFNSILDHDDKLLRVTYSTAIKASNSTMAESERKLLKMVFRLWVASRMTTKSIRLCGEDTLDIPHNLLDESHPMHGQVPITPVMSAQIDVVVTHGIMIPLRDRILGQLSTLILANKLENWFCIYLCVFVLLHDCSLKIARNAIYARKHGMKSRFANMDDISEIYMGANILLAHFHYSCKGFPVFKPGWKAEKIMSVLGLNAEQVQFIQRTTTHVQKNKAHFAEVVERRLLEHQHYFIAQLYEVDWEPKSAGQF